MGLLKKNGNPKNRQEVLNHKFYNKASDQKKGHFAYSKVPLLTRKMNLLATYYPK